MCAWLQNEPTDFMNALMNAVKHVALGMFQDRFKPASSKSVFGCFNLTSKYQYIWKKFLLLPSFKKINTKLYNAMTFTIFTWFSTLL